MKRDFQLVGILALAAMLCLSPTAQADVWRNLQLVCKELHIPQIDQFIGIARAWEKKEVGAQGDLGNLANNVCPAYLQNANAVESLGAAPTKGAVTLQQYVAEQTRTFSNALDSDSKGHSSQAYLKAQFDDLTRTVARARVNFSDTLCGKYITERYQFIAGELQKIQEKTLGVQKTCPKIAANIANDPKEKRVETTSYGQGSVAAKRAPARATGSSSPDQSTITGKIDPQTNF